MAQQLGANSEQIQTAVSAALPLLLGALGKNAAQPQGAADLLGALQRDHSQALPQGLGGLGGLLGSILGGSTADSAPEPAGQWCSHLGPYLGWQPAKSRGQPGAGHGFGRPRRCAIAVYAGAHRDGFFSQSREICALAMPGSLSQTLEQERAQAQQQGGLGGDLLGSLVDQNGDGKLDVGDLFKLGQQLMEWPPLSRRARPTEKSTGWCSFSCLACKAFWKRLTLPGAAHRPTLAGYESADFGY